MKWAAAGLIDPAQALKPCTITGSCSSSGCTARSAPTTSSGSGSASLLVDPDVCEFCCGRCSFRPARSHRRRVCAIGRKAPGARRSRRVALSSVLAAAGSTICPNSAGTGSSHSSNRSAYIAATGADSGALESPDDTDAVAMGRRQPAQDVFVDVARRRRVGGRIDGRDQLIEPVPLAHQQRAVFVEKIGQCRLPAVDQPLNVIDADAEASHQVDAQQIEDLLDIEDPVAVAAGAPRAATRFSRSGGCGPKRSRSSAVTSPISNCSATP